MLVLKKQVTDSKYEILDTNDGVVEVATVSELNYYVKDLGIEIQGVKVNDYSGLILVPQFEHTMKETKLKVFKGVDMHVENGELVKFTYTDSLADTKLKLSDYCTFIAPHCFKIDWNVHTDKHIVLVLDDNIDFSAYSFIDAFRLGIILFDVSELSDKKASYVYKEAMKNQALGVYPNRGYDCVIDDNAKRKYYYWADCVLKDGLAFFNGQVSRIEEVIPYADEITRMLEKKYKAQLERAVSQEFDYKEYPFHNEAHRDFVTKNINRTIHTARTRYEKALVYLSVYRNACKSSSGSVNINRLCNLVTIFPADSYYVKLWGSFCRRMKQVAKEKLEITI